MDKFITAFFIAIGVVLGGAFSAGIGAILTHNPPLKTMIDLAADIKLWAIVVAMGGTFSSLRLIETGLFAGQFSVLAKQLLLIFSCFLGAQIGYLIVRMLFGG